MKARARRVTEDRGAMALIVAIVVPVLLLGIGAVVVDVGGWYAGRAQDQNGADAAAVAVANTCATGACDTTVGSKFVDSATSPNGDLSHQYAACGNSSTGGLNPCANVDVPSTSQPVLENHHVCPFAPSVGNYVDVLTVPKNSDGSNTISSLFGKGKQQVAACSQVQWGQLGGGTGLALGMSLCAWETATGGSVSPEYATPEPPYPANAWPPGYTAKVDSKHPVVASVGGENVVQIHGVAKPCNDSSSGLNVPGGFAWLSNSPNGAAPADCVVETDANGYVYNNPGNLGGKNSDCANAFAAIYAAGTSIPNDSNPIYLPVFDLACDSNGSLSPPPPPPASPDCPVGMPDSSYHIAGYATFVLTGYDVSPISEASMITGRGPCKGSFDCIYGMFTKGLTTARGDICVGDGCGEFGGPTVVKLTG